MKKHIKSLNILTDSELNLIDSYIKKRSLKKGDFLIREGQICKEITFIKKGSLRSYFVNENGEEVTNCISFENDLMNAYSSFIKQEPCKENIQAVIDTEIEFISKKDIESLFNSNNNWQKVGRTFAEQEYINLENRIISFQRDTAMVRYSNLEKNHPQYIKQIPLHYIASYLGISSRHLTRIRKDIL